MQEAYVRGFQHIGEFAGEAKFSTWLTTFRRKNEVSGQRQRNIRAEFGA
jgi:DNA-directed RNA polymerase specialized sigma24 family protein